MQLAAALRDHYWAKGWVVVEGVFPPAVVEPIAALALELAERELSPSQGPDRVDRSADGTVVVPRKLDRAFGRHEAFRRLLFPSPLPGLIEQLIGVPPLLHDDQVFFKPPRHGSPKAYHQDNAYFRCHPADHVVTAWLALDEVDEANGRLRYIDGSHRGPILESRRLPDRPHDMTTDPASIDLGRESLAPVGKGGVVLHHGDTLHASGPNASSRWRRAYSTHWLTARTTCETDLLERVAYFRQPALWTGLGVTLPA